MNHSKKVILVGTTGGSLYGFRADLIRALVKDNHRVYAFISEYIAEDLEKIKQLGAIPVIYDLSRGGLNPFRDILSVWRLKNKIKKIQPDIVFSYFVKPVIYGTLSAKWANVPKVVGMLEGLGYFFTEQPNGLSGKIRLIKWVQILLYKLSLPLLDGMILLNHDDIKDLLDRYHIKVNCLEVLGGIGVNLEDFPFSPIERIADSIRFLFVGRLLKEKGIYEYIEAAKIVKQKYPDVIFTVLGGIDEANLGALAGSELNHYIDSNLIEYVGYSHNVCTWLIQSHVFVLPSYREGMPRSTQEAMAVGRAIITTDVPGCRETVLDGVNGFLIPKWNIEALAEKMIFFIENPELIGRMGARSHQIALEKFDVHKVNCKLVEILGLSCRE